MGVIVGIYANRDRIRRLKIASVFASVPPKAGQSEAPRPNSTRDVWMIAPWALSALPECLRQTFEASGPRAYVMRHMPKGYALQLSGTLLRFGDCAVVARKNDVFVRRGKDKFYIPPRTQLYRRGNSIALLYENGLRAVLRVYSPSSLR